MLYNYLITAYKVVAGLVTPERLIGVALGAFGFYLVWIVISLISSFQRKFNSRCQELINIVLRTKDINVNSDVLNLKTAKISSGFGFGWKKFKDSPTGKPSDFISRRESLDVEINGGVLNQGKTFMRAYIALVTVLLFIFNFVYIGGENAITFVSFAESLILPLVFYVVIKLFYFLHNSIKQKLYRMDIESFYEVIDLLDSRFAKKGKVVVSESDESENNVSDVAEEEKSDEEVVLAPETVEESAEPENALDKYDVFKKKNIDVSKIMNETPKSDSSLPFINVDSDYVIKDDAKADRKQINQEDASSVLGGMMQNVSSKKSTYVDIEKNIAQIDNEKIEQLEKKDETVDFQSETENVADNEEKKTDGETLKVDTENDIVIPNQDKFIEIEENKNEVKADENIESNQTDENDVSEEELKEEKLEEEKNNIANVVSSFKANRPKLGAIVIEKNQPIAKRERPVSSYVEEQPIEPRYSSPVENEITRPVAEENTDTILNSLKSIPGAYDNFPGGQTVYASTNYGTTGYDQNFGYTNQPMYNNPMSQPVQGFGYNQPMQSYPNYSQPVQSYSGYNQPAQNYDEIEPIEEETSAVSKEPKKKIVRTKENEPRPRNLRSSSQKVVEEDDEVRRGRPKKQEVSESMTIKNDAEFNDVLSRAEKLMRKSEEGLSDSQSKRVEKELKILMDAMSKYKENK